MKMSPPAPRPLRGRRRQSPRPAPGPKYWNALWPRHSRPSPSSSPPGRTRPSAAVFAFGGAHRNTPSAWGARRWSAPHMPPVAGIHLAPVYAGPSIPLCHSSIRRAPRGSVRRAVPGRSRWARVADQDQLPRVDGPAMLSKDSCQTGALLDWHVVAVGRLPRVDAPTLNVPGQRKSSSRLLMSSPRGAHRVYPTKPRRGGTRMGHHDRIGIRWQQRVIPFRPARTVADTRRVIEDA